VGAAGACTLLNPLDAYGPPKAKPLDAGADSSHADGGLVLAHPPGPPAHDDGTGALEVVFAASSFNTGDEAGGVQVGYDLDNVWTCPGPPSCAPSAAVKSSCDADRGVDNGGTKILQTFLAQSGMGGAVTAAIQAGRGGFLLTLKDYNGTPNDTRVLLSLFASTGIRPDQPGGDSPPPKHDGTDVWMLDRRSLYGGSGPPYVANSADIDAYVTDGVLVGHLDLALNLDDLIFDLRAVVFTARITKTGDSYRLDEGIMSGRWPTAKLLTSLDTLKDPFNSSSGGLCGTSALYQSIKSSVCSSVDLVLDPAKDNAATPARCDAVGLTITFTGEPAALGDLDDGKAPKHLCGDGYSDDCAP
jgi:hypothetical protein